ncbi:MAG TPA: hypothetical protein VEQ41_04330 [Solirubrobacterales bacterium]|nr:hypothetical protein [Solirubrobacterales bacterium]
MPRFSVKIEGSPLIAAQIRLNGTNIPTLGVGAHWGDAPPPGWDLDSLRAVVNAQTPAEAKELVKAQLPPEGTYELQEAEPHDD